MKILNEYVIIINKLLEKPRNELSKKIIKKNDKRIEKIIHGYDLALLEKYRKIEKIIDEEVK